MGYLHHSDRQVRAYASGALDYWPEADIEPRVVANVLARGPTPEAVQQVQTRTAELVKPALPYLESKNPVLQQGAIAVVRNTLMARPPVVDAKTIVRIETRVLEVAAKLTLSEEQQTANDFAALLGLVRPERARPALWSLVERDVAPEQALIALMWLKNPGDLKRITDYLITAPETSPSGNFASVAMDMRQSFGDAGTPALRTILSEAASISVRINCAGELIALKDPAGYAFAIDAMNRISPGKAERSRCCIPPYPRRGILRTRR